MISYLPSYWCTHIASPLCFSPIPHSIVTSKLCLKHFIAAHPFFSRTYLRLPAHTNQIPTHMCMLGQCSYLHSADLTLHPPHISFPIRIPQLLPHLFYYTIMFLHFPAPIQHFTISIQLMAPLTLTHTCTSTAVHTASLRRGDIRLYADPDNGEGAVEFYHQSLGWSGICPDSNWGTSEAIVACRQLGYETGRAVTYTR